MRKKIIFILICSTLCIFQSVKSQIIIGDDSVIEDGVVLKVNSSNMGVILPMIKLESRNEYVPLEAVPPTGTLVFNTDVFGSFPNEVYKGLYWWDNDISSWLPFALDVKNYTIKYVNTDVSTNLCNADYTGVPLLGSFQFSDVPTEFEKISDSEIKFNSEGIYSITINLDLYTALTDPIGIKAQILKNGLPTNTTIRYITSQRTEDYFSANYTEYLDIEDGDTIKIQAMQATDKEGLIRLNTGGTSSITISRIR